LFILSQESSGVHTSLNDRDHVTRRHLLERGTFHLCAGQRGTCERQVEVVMPDYRAPRILVVEDEPMIAMELEDILIDLGFEVYVAHDLPTGIAFFHARSPDLGIFDVHIGSELIFPLATELRGSSITIIFMTCDAPNSLPLEWATCQIVPKPLNVTTLYAALCAWVLKPWFLGRFEGDPQFWTLMPRRQTSSQS
jgi:CheY-like chemotaxis protein